jgi:membrane-associated phospholipid phosphatase
VVVPFAYIAFSGQPHAWADAGLVFESTLVSMALTQATKKVFRRTRPYALRRNPPPGADPDGPKSRVSFFSGHTSLTFALAVSSGTIAFERDRGNAGLVLGSGLVLAATTGYLRIAADWHYFIDVLVGAAVGSLSGYLVPKLHDVKEPTTAATARASRTAPTFSYARPVGESAGVMVNARLGAGHRGLSLTFVF